MPTYIVGDIHISDPATYQAHLPRALATIARFGGRVIAGGGKIDLLEGDPMPEGIFIIEFQTADAARRWYQSDDYQEALKVRLSSSCGRVFLIEGNEISSSVPVAGFRRREKLSLFRRHFDFFSLTRVRARRLKKLSRAIKFVTFSARWGTWGMPGTLPTPACILLQTSRNTSRASNWLSTAKFR